MGVLAMMMLLLLVIVSIGVDATREHLANDEQLYTGQSLMSNNGKYRFDMQDDGNAVVYKVKENKPNKAIWCTAQATGWCQNWSGRNRHIIMQRDGNCVLYANNGQAVWASNTCLTGRSPYRLSMQNDGNLCVYDSDQKRTWEAGCYKKKDHHH